MLSSSGCCKDFLFIFDYDSLFWQEFDEFSGLGFFFETESSYLTQAELKFTM
jgi:hypothetical protein